MITEHNEILTPDDHFIQATTRRFRARAMEFRRKRLALVAELISEAEEVYDQTRGYLRLVTRMSEQLRASIQYKRFSYQGC